MGVLGVFQIPAAFAAISVVQGPLGVTGSGVTNVTKAYGSNISSGNILVAVTVGDTNTGGATVSDTKGNTWTTVCDSVDNQVCTSYATASSSGADTVKVQTTSGTTDWVLVIWEIGGGTTSGVCQQTGHGATNSAQTSSSCSFSATPFLAAGLETATTFTPGTGYADCGTGSTGLHCQTATSGVSSPTFFPMTATGSVYRVAGIMIPAAPTTSTINLTCIVKEAGAPSETVTLSGGSPSPATATCSTGAGTTTAITVTPSCTLTVTVATDGANTRYRFNSSATSATTQNITCPAGGGSSSVTIWNYYQLQNTYQIVPQQPRAWDGSYSEAVTGTVTGATGTTGCTISTTTAPKVGIIIPLYEAPPSSDWTTIENDAAANPDIQFTIIANPSSGPGGSFSSAYNTAINAMQSNNVRVLGYIPTKYTHQPIGTVESNITKWTSFYPQINGIFFDQVGTTAGNQSYYTQAVNYADAQGYTMTYTVGNPGVGVNSALYNLFNDFNIWEKPGTPSTTTLSGITTSPAAAFGFISNGISASADTNSTYLSNVSTYVFNIFITSSNAYTSLPSYFATLVSNVQATGGESNCSAWFDYNTQACVPASFASVVAGTWTEEGTRCWTDTTGANTHTSFYDLFISQNIKCSMDNSAPQATLTIGGAFISPTTLVCDAANHSFTWVSGATITATEPSDATNTRDRFNSGGVPFTTVGTWLTSAWAFTNYYQLQNTYTMTPLHPSTWDQAYNKPVTGTVVGVAAQTSCTFVLVNGGGAANCNAWFDYNRAASEVSTFTALTGNWIGTAPVTFTDTTGGNSHNVNYNLVASGNNVFKAVPIGSTWDSTYSIAITGVIAGTPGTICTITTTIGGGAATCSGAMDIPSTATFPATLGATTTERWFGQAPLTFTPATTGNTFTVNYWLQWNNTFKATPNSPAIWDFSASVPIMGTQVGGSVTLCSITVVTSSGAASCHAFADAGSIATFPTTLSSSWTAEPPNTFGPITTGGNTYNVKYDEGPITTVTVIGSNVPTQQTWASAYIVMLAPMVGGAVMWMFMAMFRRKGDLVVTLWLFGALLGTAFFALNNGTAVVSDIIPFAMLVIEAFQFVAWIWISGIGGNPQRR